MAIFIPMRNEKYVTQDKIPFVTTADRNSKTGLFSPEIFGLTEKEKLFNYAYINLKCIVMRPAVLDMFRRVDTTFVSCCLNPRGALYRVINGKLTEVDDTDTPDDVTGSGSEWLYNQWNKIDFKLIQSPNSKYANRRLKEAFLKYSRDDIFTNMQYVLPLLYREEMGDSGQILKNEYNQLYSDMLRYTNLIDMLKTGGVEINRADIVSKIQAKVQEFFDIQSDKVNGAHGMAKKSALSRAVDRSARMTIIPAVYPSKKIGQSPISLRATGVPIHHLVPMFQDFVIKFSRDFIENLYNNNYFNGLSIDEILPFYDNNFLADQIEKMDDPYFRIENFQTPVQPNGKDYIMIDMEVYENDQWKKVQKPLTWIEFFYIVLESYLHISETKHVLTVRYPIDSMLSTQPVRPIVMTLDAKFTRKVRVMSNEYTDFPYIGTDITSNFAEKLFETSARITSSTAVGFNGDFDGDSIGLKPVLSEEANECCQRIQNTLLFNFDYGMNFRRSIGKGGDQAIYSLMRDARHNEKTKHVSEKHPFVDYLLNKMTIGDLDVDIFYAYIRSYKPNQKPELSLYDTVDIKFNGKPITTTIGRLLFNRVVFYQTWNNKYFHYINKAASIKDIVNEFKYIAQLIIEKKLINVDVTRMIDQYQEVCLRLSTVVNASVTAEMLTPNEEFNTKKDKIINDAYAKYQETGNVIDFQDGENKAIAFAKEYFKDNPMKQIYDSNNKAQWGNDFKQLCITQGVVERPIDNSFTIVPESLNAGTKPEHIADTINVAMKSAASRGILTARGGALFKELSDAFQTVYGIKGDCGSTKGEIINTNDKWELLNKYVIVNKKSILITLDNVDRYLGKDIEIRSPFYCKQGNDCYCSHCIGETAFHMTGEDKIPLGMYLSEIGNGIMNAYMKAVHVAGVDLFKIKDLNDFVFPKAKTPLFYTKFDDIDKKEKIYCNEKIEWRVPKSAVTKVGTTYLVLAHGSMVIGENGDQHTFVLGTEVSTNPIEVLNPDQKTNEFQQHYIFRYAKDTAIINMTATNKTTDTVYKMLTLFMTGNVSNLVPIEAHKKTLYNSFKTNRSITASPLSYDVLLATLSRSKSNPDIPARVDNPADYVFVSISDLTLMGGSFSAALGPDGNRALFIVGAETPQEQTKKLSPIEKSIRM